MRPILSEKTKKESLGGLHYTTSHGGKMTGLMSLSTSVLTNPHCIERMKNGSLICSKCFAAAQMNRYKNMSSPMETNAEILNSRILSDSEIPVIPVNKFRFEAFGDLSGEYQFINYIRIAELNPDCRFALWTKNLKYVDSVLKQGYAVPSNMQIVFSSPIVNVPVKSVPEYVDKVFTVYDSEYASENGVSINCGARSCMTCGRCYRGDHGEVEFVNELLKKNGRTVK